MIVRGWRSRRESDSCSAGLLVGSPVVAGRVGAAASLRPAASAGVGVDRGRPSALPAPSSVRPPSASGSGRAAQRPPRRPIRRAG